MASGIASLVSRSRPPPRPYLSNTSSSRLPPPCRRLHPAARRARSGSTRIRCVATVKSKIRVHWFRCATISSDERCILAACVAPPSNTGGILGRRALPTRRLTRLDATPGFHHVLLGRQEPGIGTLASYDWLDLSTPEGYDRLVEVLDPEFNPKGIAQHLKTQLTKDAKGMLVEHGYIDKDYRSTFYNFYAKMGRQYRPDCVRLHFFDSTVSYDEARSDIASADNRPEHRYFGYTVLRPTIVATLGRSLFSPDMRLNAKGNAIQSLHHVNLLGRRLQVWGFPSMAQHIDIAVCAHVSCWAILRYYSETFPQHQEYLLHDITKLVAPFDPGGLLPSLAGC